MGEIKKIIVDYAGRSTMHGLGFLASAKSLKVRVFWSIVCLTSMGMFVFMLISLVIHYLSFPILVKVQEVSMDENYIFSV